MVAGILFAILFLIGGHELLAEGLSSADQNTIYSYRSWYVGVGFIYPSILFVGIHLLYQKSKRAVFVYSAGCLVYVASNLVSFLYAKYASIKTAASVEDLGFCILFICIAFLVYFISNKQGGASNA